MSDKKIILTCIWKEDEFHVSDTNRLHSDDKAYLTIDENISRIEVHIPHHFSLVTRKIIERRVQSIVKSGFLIPTSQIRIGRGFDIIISKTEEIPDVLLQEGHKYSFESPPPVATSSKPEENLEPDYTPTFLTIESVEPETFDLVSSDSEFQPPIISESEVDVSPKFLNSEEIEIAKERTKVQESTLEEIESLDGTLIERESTFEEPELVDKTFQVKESIFDDYKKIETPPSDNVSVIEESKEIDLTLSYEESFTSRFLSDIVFTFIIAPLSSLLIVVLFTSSFYFISQEHWPNHDIIWNPVLYLGGIIGGLVGAFIAYWEVKLTISKNYDLSPAQLFSPDLFYLGLLFFLTYILEILSESIIIQGLLFLLEIALFIVIGRNISKFYLKNLTTEEESLIINTTSET